MDAYISGRAGIAILQEGEALSSLDVSVFDKPIARRPAEVRLLLASADDFRLLENVTASQVARELQQAYDCVCALDLTLLMLDADLLPDTRFAAATALAELIVNPLVQDYLELLFYAQPLPASADFIGASLLPLRAELTDFLEQLQEKQFAIQAVFNAWEKLPPHLFDNPAQQQEFYQVAVKCGVFFDLAKTYAFAFQNHLTLNEARSIYSQVDDALAEPEYTIMRHWVQPLLASLLEVAARPPQLPKSFSAEFFQAKPSDVFEANLLGKIFEEQIAIASIKK